MGALTQSYYLSCISSSCLSVMQRLSLFWFSSYWTANMLCSCYLLLLWMWSQQLKILYGRTSYLDFAKQCLDSLTKDSFIRFCQRSYYIFNYFQFYSQIRHLCKLKASSYLIRVWSLGLYGKPQLTINIYIFSVHFSLFASQNLFSFIDLIHRLLALLNHDLSQNKPLVFKFLIYKFSATTIQFKKVKHMGNKNPSGLSENDDQYQPQIIPSLQAQKIPNQKIRRQSNNPTQVYTDQVQFSSEQLYSVPEDQMADPIHKNIVAIVSRSKFGDSRGSGLLISRDLVLTCAHNLFFNQVCRIINKINGNILTKIQIQNQSFQIYPGQCGLMQNPYKIDSVFVPQEYRNCNQSRSIRYDYALIKLAAKVPSDSFFPLFADTMKQECMQIAIFGYPGDAYYQHGKKETLEAVTQKGLIRTNCIISISGEKKQILHKLSTKGGQSGSAIIQVKNEKMRVIGIHKGGVIKTINGQRLNFNSGRLIDKQVLSILAKAAQNLKAEPFESNLNRESLLSQIISDRQWNAKGEKSFKDSDFQNAKKCFQKAIQMNPSNYFAYNNLGTVLKCMNEIGKAIECYDKALKINPKLPVTLNNLGSAYQKQGNIQKAQSYFREAIDVNPKQSVAYNNLGLLLKKQGRIQEAIKCYQISIQINPESQLSYFNMGILYFQLHKKEQAINYYLKAIERNPRYLNAYYRLGLTHCDLENYSEAINSFQKCIDLKPSFKEAAYLLKKLANRRKK